MSPTDPAGQPAGTATSPDVLSVAVTRDIITADQAARLQTLAAELAGATGQKADAPTQDDEKLRFVTGFADIFVTLGILLFVGALAFIMDNGSGSTPALAGIAASTWLLAEFFTGKKRMALPSIVLLVLFVGSVLVLSLQIFTALLPTARSLPDRLWFIPTNNAAALALAALTTAALAAFHYVRFRVPITVAAGAAALCLVAAGTVSAVFPAIGDRVFNIVVLVCGLAVFALAMRFDMSDPARQTRRTDIAFWLHLLAAPLIVHPLLAGLLGGLDTLTVQGAVGVLIVFALLALVAVIIDRRAILVSALVYAGFAFGSLVRNSGLAGKGYLTPVVLLALGALILLLSAGWHPLRRALLNRLPFSLARRLPHPLVASHS